MNNKIKNTRPSFRILTLVLNDQQIHKFKLIAKEKDICYGIVLQGSGTINNHVLNLLGIRRQRQTLINIFMEKEKAKEILDYTAEKLKINEFGHGIAYMTSVNRWEHDADIKTAGFNNVSKAEEESMFKKLTVIVNRGMADDVMDIAREFGARGGTILHGRGTGADSTVKLFGMEIEPEKELIIIILPATIVDKVSNALSNELKLELSGQGVLFVEPVFDVRGIVEVSGEKDS